jgi:hypothetical protein
MHPLIVVLNVSTAMVMAWHARLQKDGKAKPGCCEGAQCSKHEHHKDSKPGE